MADALTPALAAAPPANPKKLIPTGDAALAEVAASCAAVWATEPTLTLRWLPQPAFAAAVAQLQTSTAARRQAAADHSPQSARLHDLDEEMNEAVRFLKDYLREDAGSKAAAQAQYAAFGLVPKRGGSLARDRGERLLGLDVLVTRLASAPFAERKYGTAFWQPRVQEYRQLLSSSAGLVGQAASAKAGKDQARKLVRKGLKALVALLEANFPDTYVAELQRWGFRRSTY
ncbi:hypothetical protein [Hymenobacter sp. CRA2]|uniref:hypothetical protein n=1 Tax=Hymenobacter sp. CRA2 TaxID=1955620 RepID=UPI00098F4647|nr:hypothetical protein [Hymenobacter sp. CRA2]OON69329.1 hypothetical protein B0919_08550 [Hymenobacter sp. CRA2]